MIPVSTESCLAAELGPRERAEVKSAVDAVCAELGLAKSEHARRRAVKERVIDAYIHGRRQPLYLVDAGLGH
ncbi:hypothetical protein GRZ55_15305 [Chelativorans sp. ZYF759]|uniref:hypothetical protein n=1 Tax=Chelativorans sp. ZYF759 TaxID=2692213 RepID=UPI00145D37B4|nr:hypothetical protein [Chelativorans sp. ZYF759]NMG40612.1 hypothetical protein [Chelativorans sp. ZYF759]